MQLETNGPKKVGRFWHTTGLSWIDISIESSVADHFSSKLGKDTSYIELYLIDVEKYNFIEQNISDDLALFKKNDSEAKLDPESKSIKTMCDNLKASKTIVFEMDIILNKSSDVKTYRSLQLHLKDNQDYNIVFFDCTNTIQQDARNFNKITDENHYLSFHYKIDLKSSSLNHLSYEDMYIFEANIVLFLLYVVFALFNLRKLFGQDKDVFSIDYPLLIVTGSTFGQVVGLFLRGVNAACLIRWGYKYWP